MESEWIPIATNQSLKQVLTIQSPNPSYIYNRWMLRIPRYDPCQSSMTHRETLTDNNHDHRTDIWIFSPLPALMKSARLWTMLDMTNQQGNNILFHSFCPFAYFYSFGNHLVLNNDKIVTDRNGWKGERRVKFPSPASI